MEEPRQILAVTDLRLRFETESGPVTAVDGVSFSLRAGEVLGVVGESGSGKSQMFLAIGRLNAANAEVSGQIEFDGQDLSAIPEPALNRLRGKEFSYIFQDPMTALNPFRTVEAHLTEMLRLHRNLSGKAASAEALRLLTSVRIPDPARRLKMYPHELSGGMRQRVVIAMALSCQPQLIIADEPTTALDVTVQLQVLDILDDLRRESGLSVVLITHDMGVVARLSDRVMVVYAGRIVETGPTEALLLRPKHPYTQALLASSPDIHRSGKPLEPIEGQPPDPRAPRRGCLFAPRCPLAEARCRAEVPELLGRDRRVACHFAEPGA